MTLMRIVLRFVVHCILTFSSYSVFATTYTFIGNGDFYATGNWQGGVRIPDLYNLAATDIISIKGNATIGKIDAYESEFWNHGTIIIEAGGSLTGQRDIRNYATFTINGTFTDRYLFWNETSGNV